MIETQVKVLASIYTAILMSGLLVLLVYGGIQFKPNAIKGKVIKATMVDISQLKAPTKKAPAPEKQPEPIKPEPKVPDPKPKEPIKQPEKEVIKSIPKKPLVDTIAQDKERKERQKRQKQLEEIRKKRIAAEKRRKIEEQNLIDLANRVKPEETAPVIQATSETQGTSEPNEMDQMMARYQSAVISSVEKQWNKPASSNKDLLCHVKVRQIPGGGVVDATIGSPCNANSIVKKSILDAIQKADPLPYKGFEKVFSRTAKFIFQPQ